MRFILIVGVSILLLWLGTACTMAEREISVEDLSETYWILESVPPGADLALDMDARPIYIRFSADMRIAGFAGCNNFMGDYTLEDNTLAIQPSATTMMACIPGKEDAPFINLLERADGAILAEGKLTLRDGEQDLATFRQGSEEDANPGTGKTRTLGDTRWEVQSIRGAEVPAEMRKKPFLTFLPNEENRLQGFGGCNNLSSAFFLENGGLSFSPIMSTKMACPDMATENAFLQALEEVDAYSIQGDRLLLTRDGEAVITLVAGS